MTILFRHAQDQALRANTAAEGCSRILTAGRERVTAQPEEPDLPEHLGHSAETERRGLDRKDYALDGIY